LKVSTKIYLGIHCNKTLGEQFTVTENITTGPHCEEDYGVSLRDGGQVGDGEDGGRLSVQLANMSSLALHRFRLAFATRDREVNLILLHSPQARHPPLLLSR
jgi:hypothetical protein